jgi:energy-coupling factor transporter ATP-binding protein EcfA2
LGPVSKEAGLFDFQLATGSRGARRLAFVRGLMIESVELQFGAKTGERLTFAPGALTLLVGPNHSGKSLALMELWRAVSDGRPDPATIQPMPGSVPEMTPGKILRSLRIRAENVISLAKRLDARKVPDSGPVHPSEKDIVRVSQVRVAGTGGGMPDVTKAFPKSLISTVAKGGSYEPAWAAIVGLFAVMIDGTTRLQLLSQVPAGSFLAPVSSPLAALYRDDSARSTLREELFKVFREYFVIGMLEPPNLRAAMSPTSPPTPEVERGASAKAIEFHRNATDMALYSDGIKAYAGISAAILSTDFRIILVDEPDAFLHPPLERRLGRTLARLANDREGNVFAATHSADFLLGAMNSGESVNVVRLTYIGKVPTARLLPASEVTKLMRDPLLRSADTLNALFFNGAVVTEADADRVFYREVHDRLVASGRHDEDSILFLNAQNKNTIHRIAEPLRKMGIPAAVVSDFDLLRDAELTRVMKAASIADGEATRLQGLADNVWKAGKFNPELLKKNGLGSLSGEALKKIKEVISTLAAYGVFVVPVGELEAWLPELGCATLSKKEWIVAILTKLGGDPAAAGYIKPSAGGVWEFLESVARWVADPGRKGMP